MNDARVRVFVILDDRASCEHPLGEAVDMIGVVVIACVLGVIPSRGGGTAVVCEHEPDAVDEIVDRLRENPELLRGGQLLLLPAVTA